MPDRNIAPALIKLAEPEICGFERLTLNNGIEIIIMKDTSHEVFRLDVEFESGFVDQPHPMVAGTTMDLLNEGTQRHSSAAIAELFDFYGGYVEFTTGYHQSEASIFSLTKHAFEMIGLLFEMLTESTISPEELDIYVRNKRQQYLVQCEKTSWLARKEFARVLWGEKHPYANRIQLEDFDRLEPDTILNYYKKNISQSAFRIFLTGNISDEILKFTEKIFSTLPHKKENQIPDLPPHLSKIGKYHITKTSGVQTGIRVGCPGVWLLDKDYPGFMLLNTLYGGYFGSRLMTNIREEKGYTYGIQSFNLSMLKGATFGIATDVNNEYADATVNEIFREMDKLRNEPVSDDELYNVKSYLYGELLRELDGVFAQSDSLKNKLIYKTDNSFFIQLINKIKNISPDEIQRLAQRYLKPENMFVVTVGA